MGKLKSQANNTFCVLNAQSVCAFAREDSETTAHTALSTLLVGVKHLSSLAFSLRSGEGGDAMCQ